VKPVYRKVRILRRSRAVWRSPRLWKTRLVFWCGALAIGVLSVVFARLADTAQHLFHVWTDRDTGHVWLPLVLTPLGFAFCAWASMRFFPGTNGSGIPQAIAARELTQDEDRERLLSLRIIFGKMGLTILGLLCGASIGREGPTVQIGASTMLCAARFGGLDMERHEDQARALILAGSAAGIAAAFNTPLAGIVFAIEEMGRSYAARANGLVLSAVILSGLAALALVGNYTYFGVVPMAVEGAEWYRTLGMTLVCGVAGGMFGAIFSALALDLGARIRRFVQPAPLRRTLGLAGICGLAVAGTGVLTGQPVFGTGYEQARDAMYGAPNDPLFFIWKLVAILASMISGIPGGIFAPSLAVGAGLGGTIGDIAGSHAGIAVIVGMAGYFAGVTQAPMTAFVIILEMTGAYEHVIPLMAASVLGYGTARFGSNRTLYHALARTMLADVLRARRAKEKAEPAG